jgi:polysaccharide pyruvyl transferase WcaK-like protein
MSKKKTILQYIINQLHSQLTSFQNDYQALQSALANETKSSAGDKYETGREMITQEVNKVTDQINKQELFIQKLKQIDSSKPVIVAGENALVESSMGTFFIGIPLGVVQIENEKVFFISFQSPIYQVMRNLKAGDHFIWQSKKVDILDIN